MFSPIDVERSLDDARVGESKRGRLAAAPRLVSFLPVAELTPDRATRVLVVVDVHVVLAWILLEMT